MAPHMDGPTFGRYPSYGRGTHSTQSGYRTYTSDQLNSVPANGSFFDTARQLQLSPQRCVNKHSVVKAPVTRHTASGRAELSEVHPRTSTLVPRATYHSSPEKKGQSAALLTNGRPYVEPLRLPDHALSPSSLDESKSPAHRHLVPSDCRKPWVAGQTTYGEQLDRGALALHAGQPQSALFSQTSRLENSSGPSYLHQSTGGNFPDLTAAWGRSSHSSNLLVEKNLANGWSGRVEPSLRSEYVQNGSFHPSTRSPDKISAGGPKSSLQALLQSAAHTYWSYSFSDAPPSTSQYQIPESTAGFSKPSLTIETIEAEAALELALDQKRKQLHGMLGSPTGGKSQDPWQPRKAVKVFTRSPSEGVQKGLGDRGGKQDKSSEANGLQRRLKGDASESEASAGGMSEAQENESVLEEASLGKGDTGADISNSSTGDSLSANGRRASDIDPNSIERRLSRIGEMLDISSLPISSKAAAQRQDQRLSSVDLWKQAEAPVKKGSASGTRESAQNMRSSSAEVAAVFDPAMEMHTVDLNEAAAIQETDDRGLRPSQQAEAGLVEEDLAAGRLTSQRSSATEEFFSVPPTPSQERPPNGATQPGGASNVAVEAEKAHSSCMEPQAGVQHMKSTHLDNVTFLKQHFASKQQTAEGRGFVLKLEGELSALLKADERYQAGGGRPEGFCMVADGSRLWAPNPRPRRKIEAAVLQSDFQSDPTLTGPQIRELFLGNQQIQERRVSPRLTIDVDTDGMDGSDERRRGLPSSSAPRGGMRPAQKAAQPPLLQKVTKSPKASQRKSRAKPIQLMSALKETKRPGDKRQKEQKTPATPEFVTDISRPRKSAVRNLQRSFNSVAGLPRGSIPEVASDVSLVSIALDEDSGEGSPGASMSSRGELQRVSQEPCEEKVTDRALSVGPNETESPSGPRESGTSPDESVESSGNRSGVSASASGSIDGPEDSSERATAADARELRDLLRQLAAEKEARRAAESRAQAVEENAKVLASSLASAVAERAAMAHQLEEECHRKASQQSALKSWADVEQVQKERQVRQLMSERDELREQVASMEALVREGQQFAAEIHRRRAQVQEREDEIQGLKQKGRQLDGSLKLAQEESAKLRERVGSLEAENRELTSAHERLRFEVLGLRKGHVSDSDRLTSISEGGSKDDCAALQQQAAEMVRLRELLGDVVNKIKGLGLVEDSEDQNEETTPGRFGGLSKIWGGKGKNENESLKARNAKTVQVLNSIVETLTPFCARSDDERQAGEEQLLDEVSRDLGLWMQEQVEGETGNEPKLNQSDMGCQTETTWHDEGNVELLTWQKERLSALEEQLQGHVQTIEALRKETKDSEMGVKDMEKAAANSDKSRPRLEEASHENDVLQHGLRRNDGESSKVGVSLQAVPKPLTLSPISPALSQLSVVGVTPKWALDEPDDSFLNQYANPIFEREAEEKEVQEARAQVDELVKEKVRLETELQAALRAAESSEERLAAAMKKVEHLESENNASTGLKLEASAGGVAGLTEENDYMLPVKARIQELETEMVAIADKETIEGALRRDDAASESRRLEEELQAVVAKWEAEAQRMVALEAEGQVREGKLKEEEARASALQRQLADAQAEVRKAEASAADALQSASVAKRRLEDKESEVRALTGAAGELRRICTDQEDVIETLRKERDGVIQGQDEVIQRLRKEQGDIMAALRAEHEKELEAERREKDKLAQEVGRLLGSLKNGSSGAALKKDDLLNLREVRGQLAAAEKRVAELEALLEEARKKDGLLGLVQKAHATIRKDMGDADKAMQEMRTRYKEMEQRMAANLKAAREKESDARAEADKLSRQVQTLRGDVTLLETALAEKEKALLDAVGKASSVADVTVTSAVEEAREQVEMHERAAREAARSVDAAERRAEEKEQALAELQRGLAETLEAASEARGRADALHATLSERERAIKSLRDELQEAKDRWQAREEGSASAQKEVADLRRSLGDHRAQVKELVAINEELLAFGQNKEREVEALHKRIKHLEVQEMGASERFGSLEAIIAQLQEEARAQASSYEALVHKLTSAEREVERQEAENQGVMAELARIKEEESRLRATMQNQNTDLEQARSALRAIEGSEASAVSQMADLKERLAERDRRVSELLEKVKVLKEEVRLMVDDLDTCRKQVDLAREEARRQEKEKVVLRNRAAQLEEDVLEREGQISILRGSLNQEADFILETPRRW